MASISKSGGKGRRENFFLNIPTYLCLGAMYVGISKFLVVRPSTLSGPTAFFIIPKTPIYLHSAD